MESLFYEFSVLSDQALRDKQFDPSTIEDLMKLFEVEAYKAWADLELQGDREFEDAENQLKEAEEYLDSVMDDAMAEFRRFEEDLEREAMAEYDSLISTADGAWKLGKNLERAATFASKKYIEAAINSATASMKSAFKAIGSNPNKVHPS